MKAKSAPFLVDTHAHLSSSRFGNDLGLILENAARDRVDLIVTIACDIEDSRANLKLAERFPQVSPTAGIHPLYVHEIESENWQGELRAVAETPEIVAIGEIGLDYFHPPGDGSSETEWRSLQRDVFERQLQLACDLSLPAVIHQRESADDVTAVLRNFPDVKAVLHCFNGTQEQAETALAMGHFISFTGILTFPKAEDVRSVAAKIPDDRIMVETDCPYLAPVPFRGKRCEPSHVSATATTLAEIRGISREEIAALTTQNAYSFFRGLPKF